MAGAARARRRGGARHEPVLHDRRRPGRRPPVPEADAAAPAARLRAASTCSSATARASTGRRQRSRSTRRSRTLGVRWLRSVRWAVALPCACGCSRRAESPNQPQPRRSAQTLEAHPGRRVRSRAGKPRPHEPRRPLQARVAHRRVERLGERLGAERAPHLLLGRRPVGRRALARHPAGRADHGLHLLGRKLLAPLRPGRPRDRLVHQRAAEIVDAGGERLPHALGPDLHPRHLDVRDQRVQGEPGDRVDRAASRRRSARAARGP